MGLGLRPEVRIVVAGLCLVSSTASRVLVLSMVLLAGSAGLEAAVWGYRLSPQVARGIRQVTRVVVPVGLLCLLVGIATLAAERL